MNAQQASVPVLEAIGLRVSLGGQRVLDIPSLRVFPNRVLAVIGPNGSGKTTLLLSLSLLLKPASGTIFYRGQAVGNGSTILQLRRKFAVVFQEPLLLNTTVWDNVTLGLKMRGANQHEIKDRAHRWLERFGINSLALRQARTLSGGEAQRTSLARAFALQPEVLFLDEPFSALDSPTRQTLIGDIASVLRETKVTTVLITHDRNEAQALADEVAVLMRGGIQQIGSPQAIFSKPADEEVARFVGVENLLKGTIAANKDGIAEIKVQDRIIEAVAPLKAGEEVYVCLRPEDITLSLVKSSTSARNVIPVQIHSLTHSGPLTRVNFNGTFPLIALITRMSADEMKLEAGKTVYASFKATAIHVIGK